MLNIRLFFDFSKSSIITFLPFNMHLFVYQYIVNNVSSTNSEEC